MAPEDALEVEVVYAGATEQIVIALSVPRGCTVAEAILRSGISQRCPTTESGSAAVGVYGKAVPADTVLCDGDRVEIYRPLIADPKQARRQRAAAVR